MSDHPTMPIPVTPADVAFARAAKKAREASDRLLRSIRKRPSATFALAELIAAEAELESARRRIKP
jgi:hypothetical protein